MDPPRSATLLPRLCLTGTSLWFALGIGGFWAARFPPPPALARQAGLAGEPYGPDVIGLDKQGWIWVNGRRYAEPVDGHFDGDALLALVFPRCRPHRRDPEEELDTLEWQVLRIERDVPMGEVDAFVGRLRRRGVPRTCFDGSVLGGGGPPRLVHAWRRELRATNCSGGWFYDDTTLVVLARDACWEVPYSWGPMARRR